MKHQFSVVLRKKGLFNNYITTLKAYYRTKSRVILIAFVLKLPEKNLFILYLFGRNLTFLSFVSLFCSSILHPYLPRIESTRPFQKESGTYPPFPFLRLGVGRTNMFKAISPRGKRFPLGRSQSVPTISHVRILFLSCSYITS